MNRKRIFTGIDFCGQPQLLEFRRFGETVPRWILWLAYNPDRTLGTYLVLNEDGSIWRETVYPEGGTDVCVITPPSRQRTKSSHGF